VTKAYGDRDEENTAMARSWMLGSSGRGTGMPRKARVDGRTRNGLFFKLLIRQRHYLEAAARRALMAS
jgi:hypothetical protein